MRVAQRPQRTIKQADPLHRLADSYIPRFRDTFRRSVERLRLKVTEGMVERDMQAPDDPKELFALLDSLEIAKAEDTVYAELITEAATLAIGEKELRAAMTVQSPFVQDAARNLTANLIRGVGNESKAAVRLIIFEAIRDGIPPARSARTIREVIGLTRRDAVAVLRFGNAQRAAATTARLQALAEARIDRYADAALRRRALNIARTETIRAGNAGRVTGWKQMADEGLIDRAVFRQRWMVTADDRLCPRCAPMEGKTVILGGSFEETERGVLPSQRQIVSGATVAHPPLHPSCRCTLVADFS